MGIHFHHNSPWSTVIWRRWHKLVNQTHGWFYDRGQGGDPFLAGVPILKSTHETNPVNSKWNNKPCLFRVFLRDEILPSYFGDDKKRSVESLFSTTRKSMGCNHPIQEFSELGCQDLPLLQSLSPPATKNPLIRWFLILKVRVVRLFQHTELNNTSLHKPLPTGYI